MFISGKQIHHAYHNAKIFFKNTYNEGRKWAQTIDGYAQLFRKGLSAATPALQDLGMGETLGTAVKGLQSYDSVRQQVVDLDTRGRGHLDRISKAIA